MVGMVFKMASLVHAVESAVGFCTSNERDLPPPASDVTGALAGFLADLDEGHIPAQRTTNCVRINVVTLTCAG